MNAFFMLELSLQLLKGVLAATTKAQAPQAILDAISGAIASIEKVHSDPVTKSQIDKLTVSKLW